MFLYLEKWILNFSNILSEWDHHLFHQSAVSIGLDIYWLFRTKLHVWNQKIGDDLLDSLQKMKTTNKYYQIILQVVNLAIPSINTSSILHQHLVGWHSIDIRPTCWLTVGRETTYFRSMYIYIYMSWSTIGQLSTNCCLNVDRVLFGMSIKCWSRYWLSVSITGQ